MDSETFKIRKQVLKNFYNEDRIVFLKNLGKIFIGNFTGHNNGIFYGVFSIDTEVYFSNPYIIHSKIFPTLLKPFIYFLYSLTYREKFLKYSPLLLNEIKISYYTTNFLNRDDFKVMLFFPYFRRIDSINFLNKIHLNYDVGGINKIHIKLLTSYININREQYLTLRGNIEDEEQEEQEEEEYKIINSSQCFKSEECVICLTNPPNVLFCNCGHLCICSECEKLKISNKCPICKINNEIIRVLN